LSTLLVLNLTGDDTASQRRFLLEIVVLSTAAILGLLGFPYFRNSESEQQPDDALTADISADIAKAAESLTATDIVKRIAGISALESLARSGLANREVAVNIFSAFIRERSSPQSKGRQNSPREALGSDIELALRSLSNLNSETLQVRIDLRGAQLSFMDLSNLNLSRTDFSSAVLDGSDLSFSNLTQASLRSTSLVGSRLDGANLTLAVLDKADLTKASLVSTNLSAALIRSANMRGSYLVR
jgi:uncharacterized protein YjbI with pentapeptide repeats